MKRDVAFVVFLLCICQGVAAADQPILPLSHVKVGMKVHGKTVYRGQKVATFRGVVRGVVNGSLDPTGEEGSFPSHLIVLKIKSREGSHYLASGVFAGMSGSPVYDSRGRLVGALSVGFGKQPIESVPGMTPIEDMLRILPEDQEKSPARFFSVRPVRLSEVPKPGEMIYVASMYGDVTNGVGCTLTYSDAQDRFLACGHGVFGVGRVSLPAFRVNVVSSLWDRQSPAKLLGKFIDEKPFGVVEYDDQRNGIAGRIGKEAQTIPLAVDVKNGSSSSHTEVHIAQFFGADEMIKLAMLHGVLGVGDLSHTKLMSVRGSILLRGKNLDGSYSEKTYAIERTQEVPLKSAEGFSTPGSPRKERIMYEKIGYVVDGILKPILDAPPDMDVQIQNIKLSVDLLSTKGGFSGKSLRVLDSAGQQFDSAITFFQPAPVKAGETLVVVAVVSDLFGPDEYVGYLTVPIPPDAEGSATLLIGDGSQLKAFIMEKHASDSERHGFDGLMRYLEMSERSDRMLYARLVLPVSRDESGFTKLGPPQEWRKAKGKVVVDREIDYSFKEEFPFPLEFGLKTINIKIVGSPGH